MKISVFFLQFNGHIDERASACSGPIKKIKMIGNRVPSESAHRHLNLFAALLFFNRLSTHWSINELLLYCQTSVIMMVAGYPNYHNNNSGKATFELTIDNRNIAFFVAFLSWQVLVTTRTTIQLLCILDQLKLVRPLPCTPSVSS